MTKNKSKLIGCLALFSAVTTQSVLADDLLIDGDYTYTVDDGEATIATFFGTATSFMLVPSELGGYPVTTVGDGDQILYSNNGARGVMLFPDSVSTISSGAVYDYNVTYFFSIPSSVTTIEDGATSSIAIAQIAGEDGSTAEDYASQIGVGFSSDVVSFSISASDGGSISDAGNFLLPMVLESDYELTFDVTPDSGYEIASVYVDGEYMTDAVGESSYEISYTVAAENSDAIEILATFQVDEDADDSDSDDDEDETTEEDVDYPVYGAAYGKYANTSGVNGAKYMATAESGSTVFYELVDTFASKDGSLMFSMEEELIEYATEQGYTYGEDYDYFHVYNYKDESDALNGEQGIAYYVAYLYKTYDAPVHGLVAEVGSFESAVEDYSQFLNTSSLYAQDGAEISIYDGTFNSYSNYHGPSEGPNFYGGASSLLVNSEATINLINPVMNGGANIAHANYDGRINIRGGEMIGMIAGAHGPYVAYGGEVYINADSTDGSGIRLRADGSQAYIERNKETQKVKLIDRLASNQTSIVTMQNTGTILATDAGGGVIVADQIVGKAYGLGSAGVYSIGSNEGLVYVYNSDLTAYLDGALVSASGGYVYVENSKLQGLMGVKLRAGQNSETMSEVHVKNSLLTAYVDMQEMERIFDVYTPEQAEALTDEEEDDDDLFGMNLFVGRDGSGVSEEVLEYWFGDGYATVPGAMGGNMLAVIYTEASKTPVVIESTKLVNRNYVEYKDAEGSEAQNLLVSSEGNGTANIVFIDNNRDTHWDVTGQEYGTTEVVGDFFIAEASDSSDDGGMPPGEPPGDMPEESAATVTTTVVNNNAGNYLNVTFENSDWEGTVLGVTDHASLSFDADSVWLMTGDVEIDTLTVATGAVIKAQSPVTLTYSELVISDADSFEFGDNVTVVEADSSADE